MKDYYSILGVGRRAGTPEIKRAFRRLANLYHPDHNPSPEAEAIIKEVIEAYQVLEDPTLRSAYDQLLVGAEPAAVQENRAPRHRDPRYRPRSVNPNYKSEDQVVMELIREWSPYALYVSSVTFFCCIILLIDFSLPPGHQTETVIAAANSTASKGSADMRIYTHEGNAYSIDKHEFGNFSIGASLNASYSPLLHVPFSITGEGALMPSSTLATIYRNFIFVPVILMITSVLGISVRKAMVFRFNLAVMNFLMLIIAFIFLLISRCHVV